MLELIYDSPSHEAWLAAWVEQSRGGVKWMVPVRALLCKAAWSGTRLRLYIAA